MRRRRLQSRGPSQSSGPTPNTRATPPTARANWRPRFGFEIVYDKSYPPSNTDYTPILRAIQAVHPDIVYVASYPPDSVGIIRAANEIGLDTKMFGGAMVGPQITATAMQLGPLLNGIVNNAAFVVDDIMANPETADVLRAYQEKAPAQGIDPLGYTFPPYAFAAMQILAEAVTATKGFDQDKIAAYVRTHGSIPRSATSPSARTASGTRRAPSSASSSTSPATASTSSAAGRTSPCCGPPSSRRET